MLDKILESLDDSIFTEESKQIIRESFDDAVSVRAQLTVEEQIKELEDEKAAANQELQQKTDEFEAKSQEYINYIEAKAEEYIKELEAKAEEFKEYLETKAEEYVAIKEEKMLDRADQYLDRVVEEFAQEAKDALEESVKSKESEMIREAFETMIQSTGVEFQKSILENADYGVRQEIEEIKESYNQAMSEVFALKRENADLLKMGLITEMTNDMTLIEAERFKRLAEGIEFTSDERYIQRLETMKESVRGVDTPVEADVAPLNENVRVQKPQTKGSKDFGNLFSFSHLV